MPGSKDINHGKRLLSSVIEERARNNYPRPYASIPVSNDLADGYRDISYRQFAIAINKCATWLETTLGKSSTLEPLPYLGIQDLMYPILTMAAVKTGHVVSVLLPWEILEAFLALTANPKCSKFLTSAVYPPIVDAVVEKQAMRHVVVPELKEFLDETHATLQDDLFTGSFDEYRLKPWVMFHTSGSTGIPKPIVIKHGLACAIDGYWLNESNAIGERLSNLRAVDGFPLFHMAGLALSLYLTIFSNGIAVLLPAAPLTPDLIHGVLQATHVDYLTTIPAILAGMAADPKHMEELKKLKGICYGGGPLDTATGDAISQYTKVDNLMGATEFATLPFLPKDPKKDWAYIPFDSANAGAEYEEISEGVYEQVLKKKPELELQQAIFTTFPEIDVYHTKDLFTKHPSIDGLWKYHGRLDDVIVFSSGEKLNPVTMESKISSCPLVNACIVAGQGRFQSTLLVEPSAHENFEKMLQDIWTYVETANAATVKHGRIASLECIIFTDASKPLPRTPKGTVQRKAANALYAKEIASLYDRLETKQSDSGAQIDLTNEDHTAQSLLTYICAAIDFDLGYDQDFYQAGFDSLQTLSLVRIINKALPDGKKINPKAVYDHPTVRQLAKFLHQAEVKGGDEHAESIETMQHLFEKFVKDLPISDSNRKGYITTGESEYIEAGSRPQAGYTTVY